MQLVRFTTQVIPDVKGAVITVEFFLQVTAGLPQHIQVTMTQQVAELRPLVVHGVINLDIVRIRYFTYQLAQAQCGFFSRQITDFRRRQLDDSNDVVTA